MKHKVTLFLLYCITNIVFATTGAKYLIIASDAYVSSVQPLADWKTKKGVLTKVIPLSVTGSSSSQIKNYILNGYNNWDIRPQYILLIGTSSVLPSSGTSDDYYADMTGNYRIELSIGRLPCTSTSQCQNIINKILMFERTPYVTDSTWFQKGTIIVREDGSTPPDDVYWENARYIANLWHNFQYTVVDTFSSARGQTSTNVVNALNDGRIFTVYRGEAVANWWSPFAITPNNLSNGSKTPIVVSSTCQTLSISDNTYLGNLFLNAGSPSTPKGAVAFFGTTIATSGPNLALNRGTVAKGFFKAISERVWVLGDAAKYGKFYLDSIQPPNFTTDRYKEWELFGDPEMHIWTATPKHLVVSYDSVIPAINQNFVVHVTRNGSPFAGATVCIMMDSTIYLTGSSNSSGNATFTIIPPSSGSMSVTVTAQNFIPYEGTVRFRPGSLDHDAGVLNIIEPQGTIASGSSITPQATIKNFGNDVDSFSVTMRIGSIYQQTVSSGILAPNDTERLQFPDWTAIPGQYIVAAYTSLYDDQWRGNDSLFTTINVVPAQDVGVDAILGPDTLQPLNVLIIPKARIKNYGSATQSGFAAVCSIVGASGIVRYVNTQTVGTIAPGETTQMSFGNWIPTIAEQCTVKIRTNLTGDLIPDNDCKIKLCRISMVFVSEGFNSTFPPDGWQDIAVSGSFLWESQSSNTNPDCTPFEGSAMASYPSYSASSGNMSRLISPPIALGPSPVRCSLKFCMYHDDGYPGGSFGPDSVKVEVSTNGTTFNRISAFRRYEPVNGWVEHTVYLGSFTGTLYFSFLAFSEYGNNMNIDFVRLLTPAAITEEDIKSSTNLPFVTVLYAPKPNPVFDGLTHISFTLAEPTNASLKIYDASGKQVKTLVNSHLERGTYIYTWNGKDATNRNVAKGVYFYILETLKQNFTKKMIFVH
jgi:hypothetical protein